MTQILFSVSKPPHCWLVNEKEVRDVYSINCSENTHKLSTSTPPKLSNLKLTLLTNSLSSDNSFLFSLANCKNATCNALSATLKVDNSFLNKASFTITITLELYCWRLYSSYTSIQKVFAKKASSALHFIYCAINQEYLFCFVNECFSSTNIASFHYFIFHIVHLFLGSRICVCI